MPSYKRLIQTVKTQLNEDFNNPVLEPLARRPNPSVMPEASPISEEEKNEAVSEETSDGFCSPISGSILEAVKKKLKKIKEKNEVIINPIVDDNTVGNNRNK